MGKVPEGGILWDLVYLYTMGLSIPTTYLVYLVSLLSSNCIVVKPRGQGLRMRTSI